VIVQVDTEDYKQMWAIAEAAYRERAKIRDWSMDNPDGCSGTPVGRNIERLKRALRIGLERHGREPNWNAMARQMQRQGAGGTEEMIEYLLRDSGRPSP